VFKGGSPKELPSDELIAVEATHQPNQRCARCLGNSIGIGILNESVGSVGRDAVCLFNLMLEAHAPSGNQFRTVS